MTSMEKEEFLPDPIPVIPIEEEIKQEEVHPVIYSPILRGSVKLPADANIKGGQTAYNTGTGFFLGYSTDAYKFSIGNPAGNYITWDGSVISVKGVFVHFAGDVLMISADTQREPAGTGSPVKVKEIRLTRSGTYRIKFDMRNIGSANRSISGQIYRNGSAVGTLRTQPTTEGDFITYSEDISGWSANDLCQLYYTASFANNGYIRNFRIYVNDCDSSAVTLD